MVADVVHILIFPGLLFLIVAALCAEYVDRKVCAKLQNRVGPPWYQPLADFIKLAAKEDILPNEADRRIFIYTPLVALAAAVTAVFYIPIWSRTALYSFEGDIIVVLYLLTIPTGAFFLAGWYSRSVFSMLGAARCITQLFAYEIPLFLSILAPALLANSWSLSTVAGFYAQHPWYTLFNIIGLATSFAALLGKLERVPFDSPEAETEIVAGTFTEYSGRLLALFKLAISVEMIVGATLIGAIFLPFGLTHGVIAGFTAYLCKVFVVVVAISLARNIFARLRIDQMMNFWWQIAAPLAFLQMLINLVAKEFLSR